MSQRSAKTVKVALTKGLITEATPLTIPPEASIDELNVDLFRDTTRPKRKGIQIEDDGETFGSFSLAKGTGSSFVWEFPGGSKDLAFLVVHEGVSLNFYNLRTKPLSSGLMPFSVDLGAYVSSGFLPTYLSLVSVKGRLVVAGEGMNTFAVEYNPTTNDITSSVIRFRIRDFDYIGDKLEYGGRGSRTAGPIRQYDSFNSGWTQQYYTDFINHHQATPELNRPHYASKTDGGFPDVRGGWTKIEGGNTLITNGHYILDLYEMDRDVASGLVGINDAAFAKGLGPETSRFTTVANYSGRVFYAGMRSQRSSSRVYFSQVVQDGNELGDLYSVNDPTAEYLSDLLDTDGGYVNIPDAEGITHLHVFGTHLLVFATNGVWSVSGVDDVFRATDYSVNRITGTGLTHPSTFVSAEGRPYWWSDTGIHTISMTEFKNLQENNLTEQTIKTFFNRITNLVKNRAIGVYDPLRKQVFWAYGSAGDATLRDNILILDEGFGAFIPWKVSQPAGDQRGIVTLFFNRYNPQFSGLTPVVTLAGEPVVNLVGDPVYASAYQQEEGGLSLIFLCGSVLDDDLQFAEFTDVSYLDWGMVGYDAHLMTGYNYLGDLSSMKNTPQVTVLCKKTEKDWGPDLTPTEQSSLLVSAFWDFKENPAYNPQQAYRIHRYQFPTSAGQPFVSEHSYVQTSVRPRGRGHTVSIKLEGEHGKAFHLVGFETIDARNSTP